MDSRYMKRCSVLLISGKCRSNPQGDITLQLPEWLSSRRDNNQIHKEISPYNCQNSSHQDETTNVSEDVERKESLYTVVNVKQYSYYRKQYRCFLKKLKIALPYDPAIPILLDISKGKQISIAETPAFQCHFHTVHKSQAI